MFRLLNLDGRAALERDGVAVDLAEATGDASLADPMAAVARHRELHGVAAGLDTTGARPVEPQRLGPPVPRPSQVFGIGLNYRDHAAETGATLPPAPLTFTKFPSCLAGPTAEIPLSGDRVDWEVELVVVIGTPGRDIDPARAWDHVAGLTLGQDVSDRTVQRAGTPPQFSLGKSFFNYGPTGPALVSVDGFADPDDVGLWCEVAGERMQDSRSRQLIFPVGILVAYLSSICELRAGDLIFTGTPAGVGAARDRFLRAGDELRSGAEVIGTMSNRCVAGAPPRTLDARSSRDS
jgi:2-keto-4-pentenoate hydratase/2-oxohepta-3-ene-1,7-dioic acid hydratase in catechol pathway